MNFLDELQSLDFNDIGRWPFIYRAAAVALAGAVATIAGIYLFVYEEKLPLLEKAEAEELKVKEAEERKEIEAENLRLKKEAEKKEVENKKLEKALREKKEAEDQERKKIEANKKAEAEALRIKNQAPDKDKLIEWVNGFSINEINISDKDIQEKKELINQKFNAFKKWALNQI